MSNGNSSLLGLVGHPIRQSPGQLIYNRLFIEWGMRSIYLAVDLHPQQFHGIMKELTNFFSGFNVTIPYKEKVIDFMDSLDTISESTGSVNLVVKSNGQIKGYNSDFYGLVNSLPSHAERDLGRILVYGTGGTARTTVYAFQKKFSPGEIFVVSRNPGKVDSWFTRRGAVITGYGEIDNIKEVDAVINCTPAGMVGGESTGIKLPSRLSEGFLAVDFVYSQNTTKFLKEAAKRGGSIIAGNDIFIHQAIENLRKWFGISVTESAMRSYFNDAMGIMSHA